MVCLLVIGLFNVPFVYSQNKLPLEQRIAKEICSCFGKYGFVSLNEQATIALDTCNNNTGRKYRTELLQYFSSQKDLGYDKGYKAGKLYFQQKVAPLLFKDCEPIKKLQIKNE